MKINLELTAKQERQLIQIGLAAITAQAIDALKNEKPSLNGHHERRPMSAGARKKLARAMAERWAESRKGRAAPPNAPRHNGLTGKQWTPAHRRNFLKTIRAKTRAEKAAAKSAKPSPAS